MKKKFAALVISLGLGVMVFTGCGNVDMVDTVYTYDKAIIDLGNGKVIEVDVKSWRDYEDGEQLQITAEDGTVYLTSANRCTLIREG